MTQHKKEPPLSRERVTSCPDDNVWSQVMHTPTSSAARLRYSMSRSCRMCADPRSGEAENRAKERGTRPLGSAVRRNGMLVGNRGQWRVILGSECSCSRRSSRRSIRMRTEEQNPMELRFNGEREWKVIAFCSHVTRGLASRAAAGDALEVEFMIEVGTAGVGRSCCCLLRVRTRERLKCLWGTPDPTAVCCWLR